MLTLVENLTVLLQGFPCFEKARNRALNTVEITPLVSKMSSPLHEYCLSCYHRVRNAHRSAKNSVVPRNITGLHKRSSLKVYCFAIYSVAFHLFSP